MTAPVKLPRRWPNSWLSASSRVVVVQLYGRNIDGAAWRADVNRARDQILAGAAFAGDQHRQVVSLQALNLIGDAVIAALAQMKPGISGSSGRSLVVSIGCAGRSRSAAQLKTLAGDGANIRNRRSSPSPNRLAARSRSGADRRALCRAVRQQQPVAVFAAALMRGARQRIRHGAIASRAGDDAQIGAATATKITTRIGIGRFDDARSRSRATANPGRSPRPPVAGRCLLRRLGQRSAGCRPTFASAIHARPRLHRGRARRRAS